MQPDPSRPASPPRPEITPGIYVHFKGQRYEVLDLARDSETEAWFVVYRPLYGEGGLWIRSAEQFQQQIIHNGVTQPRFRRLTPTELSDG